MVRAWGILVALLLALVASMATAREPVGTYGPRDTRALHYDCIAYGSLDTTIAEVAADPSRWHCGRQRPQMTPDKTFFRFDIAPGEPVPHFFLSRRSVFDTMSFLTVDADGSTHASSIPYARVQPALLGYMFKTPLPPTSENTRTIYAAMSLPTQRITLERAIVAPQGPGFNPHSARPLFLLCGLCGMLLMPMILNLGAFRVLRQPFLLWHSAMIVSIVALILFSSGLYNQIGEIAPQSLSFAISTSFSSFVATGGMFAYSYLEPDSVNPRLRALLPWAALWSITIGLLHAAFPFAIRALNSDLYYAGFIPVLVLFVVGLGDALRRGSRAAKFQLFGWAPLLLLGAIRISSALLPFGAATDAMALFYVGVVFDALATTLGVSDRYMAMKHARDRAEQQARAMESISERDPLTGLLNRRAIEPRFAELHADGFETLAVLDLDRFKAINDDFGHRMGDAVLKAAASALAPDNDTMSMRLGGEEFLLLLRGKNSIARAEQRRQAISARVANEVAGLDRVVTASMGIVQIPLAAMPDALFADLYNRADQLLYEAKQAGRNRMVSEKMTAFAPGRKDRRKTERRKAVRAA
jgi:diguanylate cyclase (GGDEF)-like protein